MTFKTLLIGQGGREAAIAWRMAETSKLYTLCKHKNPSLWRYSGESGGDLRLGDPTDPDAVVQAARFFGVDLVFVSSDDPLAAGVIDALRANHIPCVGPTRAAAEIEWSKNFSRKLLDFVAPEANPLYFICQTADEVEALFKTFPSDQQVAIKPVGLTGGKGVKVMGPHLDTLADAKAYALEVLAAGIGGGGSVIIEEKMVGAEFTIQAFTDGTTLVVPNGTCDYPYRYDNDQGPKTGGMGTYSVRARNLPYLSEQAFETGAALMRRVLDALKNDGRDYSGAFYGSFFALPDGRVKVVEFNARYGDPEGINIMMLLKSPLVDALKATHAHALKPEHLVQKDECSALAWLVAPDYALRTPTKAHEFTVNVDALESMGCNVFFGSCEHVSGDTYRTLGASRTVAIGTTDPDLETARARMYDGIRQHVTGPLEFRSDIASAANIAAAKQRLGG